MAAANEGANFSVMLVPAIPFIMGMAFMPEQRIKRIFKARDTANWNDENTMSLGYISLYKAQHLNGMCA
jgi:hypothetical protein